MQSMNFMGCVKAGNSADMSCHLPVFHNESENKVSDHPLLELL